MQAELAVEERQLQAREQRLAELAELAELVAVGFEGFLGGVGEGGDILLVLHHDRNGLSDVHVLGTFRHQDLGDKTLK